MPQPYLDRTSPELFSSDVFLGADVERMKSSSGQERGAIFTRLEVVCFMEKHAAQLKARHCAQRGNGSWYRTIDRITPSLARTPKLLIPDIKGSAHIVLEDGLLYPHHNLYFIVAKEWPLPALQAVLRAGIAHLFVRAYSTKMHGGCLRFQAQYLRRIRLPHWRDISIDNQQALRSAAASNDVDTALAIVGQIYHLDPTEKQYLTEAK